jgi:hypothetical protein
MPNIKHLYPPPTPVEPMKTSDNEKDAPAPTQGQLREMLRKAIVSACDYDTLKAIVRRVADEARVGNGGAAKLLFELYTGKPEVVEQGTNKPMLTPAEVEAKLKEMGYERR